MPIRYRGFPVIELLSVIWIMAVLTGVLHR